VHRSIGQLFLLLLQTEKIDQIHSLIDCPIRNMYTISMQDRKSVSSTLSCRNPHNQHTIYPGPSFTPDGFSHELLLIWLSHRTVSHKEGERIMPMAFAYLRSSHRRDSRIVRAVVFCTLISVLALVNPFGATNASAAVPVPVNVTVNASQSLGTLTSISKGLNTAVWDSNLLDSATAAAVNGAGVRMLRYPGGSTSDVYHWQSATNVAGQGYANPNNNFDAFMGVAKATDSQAMITVNYGDGTPQEAAGWVQYANKGGAHYNGPVPTYTGASSTGHRYGAKYWEIGNENYGNGTYGADWEYDTHPIGPSTYATNVVAFSQAMKAVDPTINVGVVLTAPGNWPDGVTSASSPQPWNDTVLTTACSSIDFVSAHWYPQGPGNETDAGLLASTSKIAAMVSGLRAKINQYCGTHASAVKIMVTESNSVYGNPGRQSVSLVNALFLADNYTTWLENGVANVDWWDLHNGIVGGTNNSDTLYGNAQYGDYGVLSNGTCTSTTPSICEPVANTPSPSYYGLQMLKYLGKEGDTMVSSSSDQSLVAVHVVKQDDGRLAVLLINKDPSASYTVSLALAGYTLKPSAKVKVYTYGENSTSITYTHSSSSSVTIAPYSLTTLVLSPTGD
jgi:alpha-L-arabinofuranosidase